MSGIWRALRSLLTTVMMGLGVISALLMLAFLTVDDPEIPRFSVMAALAVMSAVFLTSATIMARSAAWRGRAMPVSHRRNRWLHFGGLSAGTVLNGLGIPIIVGAKELGPFWAPPVTGFGVCLLVADVAILFSSVLLSLYFLRFGVWRGATAFLFGSVIGWVGGAIQAELFFR
ncbi:hypothetical protein [Thioclava sp. GXIMD4216]|uniref:hypothetical protein n=1 Tax=Thioclava sp. GXIMD4216 TaxID=3131929 RepID=UPI0030CA7657